MCIELTKRNTGYTIITIYTATYLQTNCLFLVFTKCANSSQHKQELAQRTHIDREQHVWFFHHAKEYPYKCVKSGVYRIYLVEKKHHKVSTSLKKSAFHLKAIQASSTSIIQTLHPARVSFISATINQVKFEGWYTAIQPTLHPPTNIVNLWDTAITFKLPLWYSAKI